MIYMVGILLGFGLTVCGSNGWKLNRQLQQNENKAQRSRVIFFFHHKNVNFFVHICKLAIIFIFIFGTMYCCRHRLIFFLFMLRFLYFILNFDTILRCYWNKRLSIMNSKTKRQTWHTQKSNAEEKKIGWNEKKDANNNSNKKAFFKQQKICCSLL